MTLRRMPTTPTRFLDGPYCRLVTLRRRTLLQLFPHRRQVYKGHNADRVHNADGHYVDSAQLPNCPHRRQVYKGHICSNYNVGCGPGDITKYGLLPQLPKTTKKLVGTDISSDMINFAKKYHQDDERLTYQVLDITANELPNNFRETFDHVFSFFCLHFASDLRKAIENIHLTLKSNGEIFFSILSKQPVFEYYESILKKKEWCQYMNNFKSRLGPFQHSTNSEELMENILKETGFKINLCKEERKLFIYSKENFMGIMDSLSDYLNIPKHLEEKFSLSQWEAVKDKGRDFIDEYGEEYTYFPYKLLIVHARKW